MALTSKQEAFAQAVAGGSSQADAYRSAYQAEKMKPEVLYVTASQLASDPKVSIRVTELKTAIASKGLWTREKSVLALAAIADGCEAKASEIVAAIKELNLMHGFNAPTKLDIAGNLIYRVELVPMNDNGTH